MLPELKTVVPGPRSQELGRRLRQVECRNTTLVSPDWPVFWERSAGTNVWDVDGNRFLDLTSAFGVTGLGHGAAAAALREQSRQLVHAMGDVHPARLKVELCEALSALTYERWTGRQGKVLLGNSGFEAVEAALKTSVLATGRSGIVAFEGAYHGLGYGALLGMGISWFQEPFAGQLARVATRLPYPRQGEEGSVAAFREALEALDPCEVAALLVEPVQGRGGIVVPHESFLAELRQWCDARGVLLVLDEIYTGFFRTGSLFACEREGVVPDLICLGKALSGGFPISACVGSARVMDAWPETRGEALHTSTFLGNPLGCAMALASLVELQRPETVARIEEGARLLARRLESLAGLPHIYDIRGPGWLKGIELRHADGRPAGDVAAALVAELLKEGLILLPDAPAGHVLALTPPFGMTAEEMDYAVECIRRGLLSRA